MALTSSILIRAGLPSPGSVYADGIFSGFASETGPDPQFTGSHLAV